MTSQSERTAGWIYCSIMRTEQAHQSDKGHAVPVAL